MKLELTLDEVLAFINKVMPSTRNIPWEIAALEAGKTQVKLPWRDAYHRPGNVVSGPTQMMLADMVAYLLVLSHCGPKAMAVTSNLNIDFLRGLPAGDTIAEGEIVKLGKTLVVIRVTMRGENQTEAASVATITYVLPRNT